MPTGKQRRWLLMRKAVDNLSTVVQGLPTSLPRMIQLEKDLALTAATASRLIGENATLRQTNRELRKMVVDLQMEKVASDARIK